MADYKQALLPRKGIDVLKKRVINDRRLLTFFDVLISTMVITPAVVGTWWGFWSLIESTPNFPIWESYMLSFMVLLAFTMLREVLQYYVTKYNKNESFWKCVGMFLLWLVYMYVYLVISILQWIGGYFLFDYLLGLILTDDHVANNVKVVLVTLVLLIGLLCSLRSLTSGISVPFTVTTDSVDKAFDFPTRMRVSVSYCFLGLICKYPFIY